MALAIWDSDSVFQITNHDRGDIRCVGRARSRFDLRCRWEIEEPERSKIYSILDRMTEKPPDSITTEGLRRLARLCLCKDYRLNQVEEVVESMPEDSASDLAELIRSRVEEYSELIGKASELERKHQKTKEKLKGTKRRLRNAETANMELEEAISTLQVQLNESQQQSHQLEETLANMRQEQAAFGADLVAELWQTEMCLTDTQRTNTQLQSSVSSQQAQLDELKHQLHEPEMRNINLGMEKTTMSTQLTQKDAEIEGNRLHLANTLLETQKLQEEKSALANRIGDLQGELNTVKDEGKCLAAQLSTSIQTWTCLRQSLQTAARSTQTSLNKLRPCGLVSTN
ncbi:hypothetical protein K469DRAFT_753010 [Zopfia rhizophila CBS 207.26]|uniref:Uncharacterized protein n=1 Tax=Zopfia rhizophila CBS 207.26 TaxID=1314779 RepID=A0A6A6DPE0_9PEZI|nr:hypothetical protein K469DRAFT_753010 [Zopfia rhizophila CBS 207.26]